MRIGFVYDMVYPYSKGGGEKRYYELASRLARDHEVHWVGSKLWDGPSERVDESGVRLHGVLKAPGRMYVEGGRRSLLQPLWFGLALHQWPGLARMDVIDCCAFPFFSTFPTKALALLTRKPLVATWHEFWGDYWQEYAPRVARVGKAVERLTLRCADSVMTVSEHTRRKLVGAGLPPSRVSVVPNGINCAAIDRAAPLPCGPDVLFVGRLIREKGVDVLLEALSAPPLARLGATCWIVGDGAEGPRLRALAARLGLDCRVKFVRWLPEEQVYGAMKSAGVLALLSEREGFGMVVLEAMACGTPVVVSDGKNSAAPDLVRHGDTGYVLPREPQAIAEAMAGILGSQERREAMGHAARQAALGYDWDLVARQAEEVYVKVAEHAA